MKVTTDWNGAGRSSPTGFRWLSEDYHNDRRIDHPIGAWCSNCQFDCDADELAAGKKSGFRECWKRALNVDDTFFERPLVFDLWNYRRKQEMIDAGKYHLADLEFEDVEPKHPKDSYDGLPVYERQWLQICKVRDDDDEPWIDEAGLRSKIQLWKWPLHCIDFETCMVAIPFNKGRRPYEQIAFQFSHHVMYEDGRVEHRGEYINGERGRFPNFDFVRTLREELSTDEGMVFRYAPHENTVLIQIMDQLLSSDEPDRNDLAGWIRTMTTAGQYPL
jgi:hypothetical protein